MHIEIRPPQSSAEIQQYYSLRWKLLRQPWGEPVGSEKDDLEESASHIVALINNNIIAVGRIHPVDPCVAQIRYMAVDKLYQGKGIGERILKALENNAKKLGATKIILHARDNAVGFYKKNNYELIKPSHLLFNEIQHFEMHKILN